ncbi:MAG TPA: hypothetical protein VG389_26285, partial [Myxococcota bacterium]|nr:hypothetical protein [Myxococcota bacterium]
MKAPLEVGRPGRFARSLFGTLAVASAGALVAACEGPPGADGTNGIDGADGMNGIDGADGANGIPGADGTNGIDGVDGTIGIDGQDGVDGTNGTNGANGTNAMPRLIDASYVLWEPANVSALNDLLLDYGRTSPTWSGSDRPVAVFDWDNTVMKNDIGDATLFFILNNDLILQPA